MKITLGVVCLLVFTVQAQNLTKNVLWVVLDSDEIDKFDNESFPVKGFYENCENCTCDKFFRDNVNDLLNWAELKKINIGTVSKGYFQQAGIKSNSRIIRGDELENGLWNMIDFFMKKFFSFDGMNFGDDVRGKKDIFVKTLRDLEALNRRFLMIAVMTDLNELNKLLQQVKDETIIITGACKTKSPYFSTENQKLFESIKLIYEIPHVVRSILDNCTGLCNNTLSRVKKRVIRSNDDEIIQYDKLDEEPEVQPEEVPEDGPEEENREPRNSSSNMTKNLIIIIEFILSITLAVI